MSHPDLGNAGALGNWPNRITLARIILVAPFVVCVLNLNDALSGDLYRRSALAVMFLMAVSDGLDGYLARRLKCETPLGRFLDPLADKLLMLCSFILLARPSTGVPGWLLPSVVVVAAIGKDLCVLVGFTIIYMHTSHVCICPRRIGKLCTTAQLATIVAVLAAPDCPAAFGRLPGVLWWLATALALASIIDYYRFGQRYLATTGTPPKTP